MGILDSILSLDADINKNVNADKEGAGQGAVGPKVDVLTDTTPNDELAQCGKDWEKAWNESNVKAEADEAGDENEKYWKGKHHSKAAADKRRPLTDNVIFESLETFLPDATRRNPEPTVKLAQTEDQNDQAGIEYASRLQKRLYELADLNHLKQKLKKATRNWAIYLLGVLKPEWDAENDRPNVRVVRMRKLLLDPRATIDEDGYTGEYVGFYREMTAQKLLDLLEDVGGEQGADQTVKEAVKFHLGTKVKFVEWWTPERYWFQLKDKVLLKKKNPHWDWGTPGVPATETTPALPPTPGINHFPAPRMPFIFLSVFSNGTQPVDETSLIGQNLSNQDRVNKRGRQIDKNADSMNNGVVVSLARSGLTEAQAKVATQALRNGGTIAIPDGAPRDAIDRPLAPGLPGDVYKDLTDTRARIRDIFGTRGSTPAGITSETTVRGKILNRGLDTDRNGAITDFIEQMADEAFNWMVQLLVVYDPEWAGQLRMARVLVSVKEGSMIPKDPVTLANQAIELAGSGKMSLLDLYKRLDYPNPEELAANAWLEANAPEVLYEKDPRVAQVVEARRAAQLAEGGAERKPPSVSISYKDLPPAGQAQAAKQAGIDLEPEGIAAYDAHEAAVEVKTEAAVPALPTV